MSEEKPLHVRVAEALGWFDCGRLESPHGMSEEWFGLQPVAERTEQNYAREIPRYDTDWSATGPLIHRYRVSVMDYGCGKWKASRARRDGLTAGGLYDVEIVTGNSPLEVACRVVLALKAAGKL